MTKLRLKNENSKCKMHACTNFLHYFRHLTFISEMGLTFRI